MELIEREALRNHAVYLYGFGAYKYVPLKVIEQAPTIDPIKAVGGCYCRECKYIRKITGLYRACERHSMMIVQPNNFCSWGKLKEAQDDG